MTEALAGWGGRLMKFTVKYSKTLCFLRLEV